jgi:hypothetical protein
MKNTFITILSFLIFPLSGMAQDAVTNFNQRLQSIYRQTDDRTASHQVVFGTVEAITAYKLGSLISKRDEEAIASVTQEINDLRFAVDLTEAQKTARLAALNRKLGRLEGNIITKSGRGLTRFVVRGSQLFLILDLGTRIYVLNALNRDPDVLPAGTLVCTQLDCDAAVEQAMYIENEAYREARERINP